MRNIFEFIYAAREVLLLLLAILVSFGLLLTTESKQAFALQKSMTTVIGAIPQPDFKIAEYLSYREENAYLRQQLMKYTLLNAEMADASRENERLRNMLRFAQASPNQLQVGEVISRGASSTISTVLINVGSNHGVDVNEPVLTMNGLVGKIMTVAVNASAIHLVTDRNFRVSVKIGVEGIRGILKPTNSLKGEVTGIPQYSPIEVGDRVATSGFSDIYPKNLPVAVVESVDNIPGENFSKVVVGLLADPTIMEYVFVLVKRDGSD